MGFPTIIQYGCKFAVSSGNPRQIQGCTGLLNTYQAGDTTKSSYAAHRRIIDVAGAIPCDQRVILLLVLSTTRNATKLTGIDDGNDFCSGSIIINRGGKKCGPHPVNGDIGGLGKIDHLLRRLIYSVNTGNWVILKNSVTPLITITLTTGAPYGTSIVTIHNTICAIKLAVSGTQEDIANHPPIRSR